MERELRPAETTQSTEASRANSWRRTERKLHKAAKYPLSLAESRAAEAVNRVQIVTGYFYG